VELLLLVDVVINAFWFLALSMIFDLSYFHHSVLAIQTLYPQQWLRNG
jgi:hypothetical protein